MVASFLRAISATALPAAAVAAAATAGCASGVPSLPNTSARNPSSAIAVSAPPSQSASRLPAVALSPLERRRASSTLSMAAIGLSTPSVAADSAKVDGALPELLTEFMVDMKCEGCVKAVENRLKALDGIKSVDVDLANQVVRVLGPLPVKTMLDALEQSGRNARLIGQGNPNDFIISAAVAEFKGPAIYGVVRLAQVNMELARIEANFSGLSPGQHGWSINEFGDLTRGAASTGNVYNPPNYVAEKPLGDLGTLAVNETGDAEFLSSKEHIHVSDLIGRSIVLYQTTDKSDPGITAAVIARSAGVGENYKKICSCDGVTIWDSNSNLNVRL